MFQLLNAAYVYSLQGVSISAVWVNNIKSDADTYVSSKESVLVMNISYSDIADVFRQFDIQENSRALCASTAHVSNLYRKGRHVFLCNSRGNYQSSLGRMSGKPGRGKRKRSPDKIAQKKTKFPCPRCKNFSLWLDALDNEGSLKSESVSHETRKVAKAALIVNRSIKDNDVARHPYGSTKPAISPMASFKTPGIRIQKIDWVASNYALVCAFFTEPGTSLLEPGPVIDDSSFVCAIVSVNCMNLKREHSTEKLLFS